MSHLFAFAWDGKVDLWSINPLEMTNYEATGTAFAVAGILIALVLDLARHGRLTGVDPAGDRIYLPTDLYDPVPHKDDAR